MTRRFALACALAAGLAATGRAQQQPTLAALKTTAEASDFTSTSTYDDVIRFVRTVVDASPQLMHDTTMGTTDEGRAMPLVVVGTGLKDASPDAVRGSGKLRVYIQANIHAGEVEGKEAAQMLLRDFALGRHADWLRTTVFLINPIYNADGNERFALNNRPAQNGPINGMGQRPNAQGYDLNRDHMKLDSPEAQALIKLLVDYDPHAAIDLHTTDGSCMAYYLTYSPPLNPNTSDDIMRVMKDEWFPFITKNVKAKHGMDMYYYGNVQGGDSGCGNTPGEGGGGRRGTGRAGAAGGRAGAGQAARGQGQAARGRQGGGRGGRGGGLPALDGPAWVTFEHVPRFNNNYVGLRNRFALLSEAYAYATFEDRIRATSYFLEEALDFASAHAAELEKACADADRTSIVGTTEATSSRIHTGGKVTILMGAVEVEQNPNNGASMRLRKDVVNPVQMYDRMWFEPATTEVVPSAYYVPADATKALELLRRHGIRMQQIAQPAGGLEQFAIESDTNYQNFQSHDMRRLTGAWHAAPASVTAPAGSWMVPMTQPLARLAFYLLEPMSDDGLVNWNFLDDQLKDATTYPILRKR
jgi:Zinc carboxypeptidase